MVAWNACLKLAVTGVVHDHQVGFVIAEHSGPVGGVGVGRFESGAEPPDWFACGFQKALAATRAVDTAMTLVVFANP